MWGDPEPMIWTRLRLIAYPLLGCGCVGSLIFYDAGVPGPLAIFGALTAIVVIFDVVFFAKRGGSQPCPKCGHPRKHRAFLLSAPCPKCGNL